MRGFNLDFDDYSHSDQKKDKLLVEQKLGFLKRQRKRLDGVENNIQNKTANDGFFTIEKKSNCLPKIENPRVKLFSNIKKCRL